MKACKLSGSVSPARMAVLLLAGAVSCGWAGFAYGQSKSSPEWTTSSYNPQRDAWQRHETRITPKNVSSIQLLWKLKTDNKTMGMQSFREPLIASGIKTAQGAKTVAIFAGSSNDVFVIDAETGTILFSKDADKPIPPASLAKLMTLELVFQSIKSGRLTLDDPFYISVNAWKNGGAGSGGSTMFAKVKSSVRLEDLIKGMAVVSANDACIAVAEGMAGAATRGPAGRRHRLAAGQQSRPDVGRNAGAGFGRPLEALDLLCRGGKDVLRTGP